MSLDSNDSADVAAQRLVVPGTNKWVTDADVGHVFTLYKALEELVAESRAQSGGVAAVDAALDKLGAHLGVEDMHAYVDASIERINEIKDEAAGADPKEKADSQETEMQETPDDAAPSLKREASCEAPNRPVSKAEKKA